MDMFPTVIISVVFIAVSMVFALGYNLLVVELTTNWCRRIAEHFMNRSTCKTNTVRMSKEKNNFLRLFKLLSGVAPKAVRELFDQYFPSSSLTIILNRDEQRLKTLQYQKRLTAKQMNLLFSTQGTIPVTSTEFDITLMICLLRNLTSIAPPMSGFDKLPFPTEVSHGADLARIKFYRNTMAHTEKDIISTSDFNMIWMDLTEAILRLGGNKFKNECENLNKVEIKKDELRVFTYRTR